MKSLKHLPSYMLCFIASVSCSLSGCKRDVPELPTDELQQVTFKLSGFAADISPLPGSQATARLALDGLGGGIHALRNIEPGLEPQYLYYWSFNEETLEPDIAVDEVGAGITFEAVASEPTFPNSNFSVDTVSGGKAFSLRGADSLVIALPIKAITSLADFAFDISSSNTGPKKFSLSYSTDGGITYQMLSADNQFENMGEQSRNPYAFDLGGHSELSAAQMLKLKMVFFAGDRPLKAVENEGDDPTPYEYNESQGTVRLDNIRLSGVYNAESGDPSAPSTLQYYIFSSEDGSVVKQQSMAMEALGEGGALDVKLAEGSYDVLFLAYRSDKDMLLPEDLTNADQFYFGHQFDDYRAVTYAVLLDDVVVGEGDAEVAALLSRCYSLVEFDFTDLPADLQRVKKIEITKGHDNFLYTPFGMPADVPMLGAGTITFSNFDDDEDYHVALHQFFGLLDGVSNITYELTAYGDGDVVLNTVTISHDIRSNVQLRLTGRLLGNSGTINGFSVALDTEWGDSLEHDF